MSEILGTLFKYLAAIMGVAAVAGIAYAVSGNSKSATAISDLNQMISGVQGLYNSQNNFSSLTTATVVNSKMVANTHMVVGTTLVNPWNGSVAVAADANVTQWDITDAGVPADGCNKIGTSMSPLAMTINGTAVTVPADAGSVVSACSSATSNTLVLTYSH